MELALHNAWETSDDCFSFSEGDDIRITVADGTIIGTALDPEERLFNYSSKLTVFNGILAGYDHGEFGGAVSFIPKVGAEYKLINENFKGFYSLKDKIYVLAGLSHMFIDRGYLYEVCFLDGKWQAIQILDLGSCPESYLLVEDILYMATNKALLVVENCKISKSVDIEESWVGLHPNSLIVANSKLYVGIRGGMISVGLDDRKIAWYSLAPNNTDKV